MKKRTLIAAIALLAATLTPAYAAYLPGMPKPLNESDIYAADTPNNFSDEVKGDPALIYVPKHW